MDGPRRIVILFFHPLCHKSRINRELIRVAESSEGVDVRHMYDLYPDFFIDRKAEQQILPEYDVIIWQHPVYWYSSPSLLKEWMDVVLEHGFAYGRSGRALEGKWILNAVSVGGNREAYSPQGARKHTLRELFLPFAMTAGLCRMEYLPPFAVHGTHLLEGKGIGAAGKDYGQVLEILRDPRLDPAELNGLEYMNDYLKMG